MFGDSGNLWAMLVIHSTDVEAAGVYLYSVITTPSLFFITYVSHTQRSNSLDLSKYLVNK